MDAIDEIETESATASEEVYPEEIYVEQDAEHEEEEPEDDSWPDIPEGEEEELEDPPPEADEAFAEGWRARSRVAGIKKQRKFVPTQSRHQGVAPPNRQGGRGPVGQRGRDPRGQGHPRPAAGTQIERWMHVR